MEPRERDGAAVGSRLRASVGAVRSQALDLLTEASWLGLGSDSAAHEAVARLQRVSNDLGEAFKALPSDRVAPAEDPLRDMKPEPSRDAAAVITLASLSVPAATPPVEKAERWLRILRLHGRVGAALHMVGVPEGPFATVADPTGEPTGSAEADSPTTVAGWAATLARRTGARTVDTVHVLFAVRKVFGTSLDRALYRQGTTWEQLLKNLVATERTLAAH